MSNIPQRGQYYTAAQLDKLKLGDSPCIMFPVPEALGGGRAPLQFHCSFSDLVEVLDKAELFFEYQYTTSEWIPIFHFVGDPIELKGVLNFDLDLLVFREQVTAFITVIGHEQPQDYHWVGDSLMACFLEEPNPAPQYLIDARDRWNAAKA